MKIPAIKQAVELYSTSQLETAEHALLEGLPITIEIEGEDDGEQLTHVMAAIWIKHEMEKQQIEFKDALRSYTQRVRTSIS